MRSVASLSKPPAYAALPEESECVRIRIEEGPLSGMVFNFNTLRIGRIDSESDEVPVKFNYEITAFPRDESYDAVLDKEATDETVAAILFDILECMACRNSKSGE